MLKQRMSALSNQSFTQVRADPEQWGREVESAIGEHLISTSTQIMMVILTLESLVRNQH